MGINPSSFHSSAADPPFTVIAGPAVRHDAPLGLPGLIRSSGDRHPERIACSDEGRALTYRELELLGDQVAEQLEALHLPDGPVALRIPRGVDVLVAMLGVLKAGRPYLPLSLDEPPARLAAILDRAAPVAVLDATGDPAPTLRALPHLAVPHTAGPERGELRPLAPVDGQQPVYVMFTSGSTGEPKGVVLGSASLCNRLLWMQREYGLDEGDRVLQKTPYTFDVSGWELFWPLLAGARCVFAPEGAHRDPAAIAALIAEHEITVCHFVPSMLAEFLRTASVAELGSLRSVFTSGEALPNALAVRSAALLPAGLHNLYGPTEAAIDVTAWPVPRDLADGEPVLIGSPIDNTTLRIVDESGEPVPAGASGELWIGGVPVAQGYIGRPDLTEAAFPVLAGRRHYRTGDLARWTGAGFEYLGRIDDQVKVDGVRIEPGEIEHVLAGADGVSQVGVVPVRTREDSVRLVAAVVADPGPPLDPRALRGRAAAALPGPFRPAAYLPLERLPSGRSGKLDRGSLGELAQKWWDARPQADPDDPLRALWTAELAAVGVDADEDTGFLSAGGRSLSAVRIVAHLREKFDVELPLRLLLDGDMSLAELRGFLAAAPRIAPARRAPEDAALPRDRSPLAPAQRRLWLLGRLHPDSAAYNVVAVLRLTGEVDRAALMTALDDAVRRHDALRARIVEDEESGEPLLRYAATARFPLTVRETAGGCDDQEAAQFAAAAAAAPVDQGRAPMARASLLHSADADRSCLVLVFNHLVADQHAVDILLAEVAAGYSAARAGAAPRLAPGPGHAAYAHRAAAQTRSPGWDADIEFWRGRLAGAPPELLLPFRREQAATGLAGAAAVQVGLDAEFCAELRGYLRAAKATNASFFLSAFATVLGAWSGQDAVVVGVPGSRRRRQDEQGLVGFLVDTLPIRLDLAGHGGFADLLEHTRERYVEALEHAVPPFNDVVQSLGQPYSARRNPVFQAWLNDLTGGGEPPHFDGLRTEALLPPLTGALFELGLYLHSSADGIVVQLVRSTAHWTEPVAAELVDQVIAVAKSAVRGARPSLLTERARATLSAARSEVGPAGPRVSVLAEVERMAEMYPDAPAVCGEAGTVTYRELLGQVAELAGELEAASAGMGAVVEIATRRSPHLPAAVLAVWRAGATACLVDAAEPAERRAAAVEALAVGHRIDLETGARLVVSPGARRTAPSQLEGAEPASHILLTSGSTGVPAPVLVPHGPVRDFLGWYTARFGFGPDDRFALLSGTAHDPALRDMLTPLTVGAPLYVPSPAQHTDPAGLRAWLAEHGITVLHATPALLDLVVGADGPRLDRLRLVVCGGAPLTCRLVRRLGEATAAAVVNAYGSTETPQIAACHQVDAAELSGLPDDALVPVGLAVAGHRVEVVTAEGYAAGVGERGEVLVLSRNLASGYLGGQRGGRFEPDARPGVRRLRTGDLGRFDPAGLLHLDGRADRQVQIGGSRLELGEVEAAARRHPQVHDAIASTAETGIGPVLTLHAQVDPGRPDRLSAADLRRHLRSLLPAHAVPGSIRLVGGFGLGPTSKARIDGARVLPDPAAPAPAPIPAAAGSAAGRLLDAVGSAVGRPVGPDENFFDAGMNSVMLLQLHAALVRDLGRPIPVTAVFAHPNALSLAAHLDLTAQPTALAETGAPEHGRLREGRARGELRRRLNGAGQADASAAAGASGG